MTDPQRPIAVSILFLLAAGLLAGCASPPAADGFTVLWTADEIRSAPSFAPEQRIVGTHYFYWYRYPDEHFYNDGARTSDALQDHFVDPESVDYRSVEWHAGELADMTEAGIDVLLPVYWGAPDNYLKPDIAFSVLGLGPLQEALGARLDAGLETPLVGLFYDTTTLLPEVRGERRERYDLRDADGRDIFYRTIRDFFGLVHPRFWATVDGRPVVVLYGSGFAVGHNQGTIDYVYRSFERDFGVRPYVIRDVSWGFRTDAVTSWGAALNGPYVSDTVAQIGPGYNDTAVPGRFTPIRDREDGAFYRWSWEQAMRSRARIILIETWNEHHEGTGIAETVEHGRRYIELTSRYARAWKAGEVIDTAVRPRHPDPLPRPPSLDGAEFAGLPEASLTFGPGGERGIRLVRGIADGAATVMRREGDPVVVSASAQTTYLYFAVADPFYHDETTGLTIEYEYLDSGHAWHMLQYDSHDPSATLSGAYTNARRIIPDGTGQWRTVRLELADARFANRQNGGADFRFAVGDGSLTIRRIVVER